MHLNKKVLDLEAKIGLGQAEELILMAKDELKLLPKYIGQFILMQTGTQSIAMNANES